MAYQNHDPYYAAHQQQNHYAHYQQPNVATDYSSHVVANDYESQSNWDAKSYHSNYTGSQAHLNPYEMSQVSVHNAPPVPPMQYHANYPPQGPQGRPPVQYQNSGWSAAREKLMKRRSVRRVELQQGNLVLDVQVPSHIVPKNMNDVEEMTKMRYTAATCDPDDFMSSRYSLRPYLYGRHTELFIVMTMYNEDEVLFTRTMNSLVHVSVYIA
jgi:chitin synthase